MRNKYASYLFIILVLATILRLAFLTNRPVQIDEALDAYEAYSLLETGLDTEGHRGSLFLRGFGFGENAVLSYFLVPFIKIGGLNVWTTRLPVVWWNILTVLASFFLVKELFKTKIALISTFLLAISPWHLVMSRLAFNASLAPLLYILGLLLLIKGLKGKITLFFLSLVPLALSFYTFTLSFLWVPLVIITFFIFVKKKNKDLIFQIAKNGDKNLIKLKIVWIFLLGFLITPAVLFFLKNQFHFISLDKILFFSLPDINYTRFDMLNIFNIYPFGSALGVYLKNYFLQLSLAFFFFDVRSVLPGYQGLSYFFEIPLVLVGFWVCIKNFPQFNYRLIVLWFLAAFIPSSFIKSFPIVHPTRLINIIPAIQILAALGGCYIFNKFEEYKNDLVIWGRIKKIKIIFFILALVNIFVFLYGFYFIYPRTPYGQVEEVINYVREVDNNYERVVIFQQNSNLDLANIYFLYYLKYDPQKFREEVKRDSLGTIVSFSKYKFQSWTGEFDQRDDFLYILPGNIEIASEPQKIFYYPDGTISFKVL